MELRNNIPTGSQPHSDIFTEISLHLSELDDIAYLVRNSYNSSNFSFTYSTFFELTKKIDALNTLPDNNISVNNIQTTHSNIPEICDNIRARSAFTGLYIIKNSKESFNQFQENFQNITYLEGAEENLKTNKNHFLKIFVIENYNYLIVYTNKPLPIDTHYKLKVLQWQLFKDLLTGFEPITIDFYKALVDEDKNKLNEIIQQIKTLDKITEIKIEKLKKLLDSKRIRTIEQLEKEIGDLRYSIQDFRNRISDCIESMEDKSIQLYALENKTDVSTEEVKYIQNYLDKSPYIESYSFGSRSITIDYCAPLIYYDDYILDKIIENYDEVRKRILQVFKEKKFELYTKCRIKMDIINFSVSSRNRDNVDPSRDIEHPHIQRYNCFGNHTDQLIESAKNSDILGALEQLTQAVLNLNFSDSIVVREMLQDLSYKLLSPAWKSKETGEFKCLDEIFQEEN